MPLTFLPDDLERYVARHTPDESELLARLAAETRERTDQPQMMVGPFEGALLRNLIRMKGAKRVLEIGTFTGYSALSMAPGLPDGGEIITCDIDPDATAIAKRYWAESPHGDRIKLHLGPALKTIAALHGDFDMVFIDADKTGYVDYWNACVPRVRQGGILVADNVMWSGEVAAPKSDDARALNVFNEHVSKDARVERVMLPIRDGITIAVKL